MGDIIYTFIYVKGGYQSSKIIYCNAFCAGYKNVIHAKPYILSYIKVFSWFSFLRKTFLAGKLKI